VRELIVMLRAIRNFISRTGEKRAGDKAVFHPTEKCPDCDTRLMHEDEGWRCPNLDCAAKIRKRIAHWCSPAAMNIAGADASLVATLVREGLVRDVAELYRLKPGEIAALPGIDRKSAQKIFNAIAASRKREAWRLLFGLSIPNLTPDEAKSLCEKFGSADNVLAAGAERLIQAKNVSEATTRSIVHWQGDAMNRGIIRRLYKAGLNFKNRPA
jgi:DNA ligase (NAD+)